MGFKKRKATTTIENCVIFLISTLAVSFFVVFMMGKYQQKLFNIAYQTINQRISNAIETYAAIEENVNSPMYSPIDISDYSKTSGKFLDDFVGVYKSCGNSNDSCFAKHYKTVANLPYKPIFEGACAILDNGEAICLKPQIRNNDITGIIDVNGQRGPNVLGKDLRLIQIEARKIPERVNVKTVKVKVVKI